MRKILIRLFIFSIPVLIATSTLEGLQRWLPDNYSHKKALIEAQAGEIETLILGSSHGYSGINPDSLDGKAFNMASAAQTIYFDMFLLQKYIDDLKNLKTVILPISYPSLGSESNRSPGDLDRSYHYAVYYGSREFINVLAPRLYSRVSLFTTKESVDRTYDYYVHGTPLISFKDNGWREIDSRRGRIDINGRSTAKMHDYYYGEDLVAVNTERIREMIRLCQERDIQFVLVSLPMYESYSSRIRSDRYDLMLTAMNQLSQDHHVPYYDFTCDDRFRKSDFFDSTHLRTKGANKFTRILNEFINPDRHKIAETPTKNEGI
ncbi:MAG: hypothetical protein R3B93_24755 [Bacteroidia bacterium]